MKTSKENSEDKTMQESLAPSVNFSNLGEKLKEIEFIYYSYKEDNNHKYLIKHTNEQIEKTYVCNVIRNIICIK